MSLDYFLFCKKKYQSIIQSLDEIIEQYETVCDFFNEDNMVKETICDEFSWMNPNFNRQLFVIKKQQIMNLLEIYNENIDKLSNGQNDNSTNDADDTCSENDANMSDCEHEYIVDYIDIDPDRCKQIIYCKYCLHTG